VVTQAYVLDESIVDILEETKIIYPEEKLELLYYLRGE